MTYAKFEFLEEDLLKVSLQGIEPTGPQFEDYLAEFQFVLASSEKLAIVLDASKAQFIPSKLRVRQGQWFKQFDPELRSKVEQMNLVATNPMVKFLLEGIFLVHRPSVNLKIYTSVGDAEDQARDALRGAVAA
ncbi:MAG TPA: hypothetical protein DCE41_06770 [Cytophagales bacterium]|nr:hypothetical protein [Cytophagales bacterium]HAA19953.1 hypothetical protein [Cytophagales bacterium]HAP62620.1 hypothetical protein [Cytophagales bacterium]